MEGDHEHAILVIMMESAVNLDKIDPLAPFRERFVVDDPSLVYVDGNSLGRLPAATADLAHDLVRRQWGARLIRGWTEGWIEAPERIGGKIARLLGADPDEVIVADSTSVNLFKLVVAALRMQEGRGTVLTDDLNFPSDHYILQGITGLLGNSTVRTVRSEDGIHGPEEALRAALTEETALLTLSHTTFKSGFVYDMAGMTAAAHAAGAMVLWDLSHSVGSYPVDLHAADADLAVGCTYKYVNGGPGAPAFLYVRRDLQEALGNPLSGWMGELDPFDFGLRYRPAEGLRRFLTGSPAVISLSLIEPGVDLLLEAGMVNLRHKSMALTEYFIALWEEYLQEHGFTLLSPRERERRGSHVSLGHPHGLAIDQALINEMNVLPDFRPPTTIRVGLAPIYTRFAEVEATAEALRRVMMDGLWERYAQATPAVT